MNRMNAPTRPRHNRLLAPFLLLALLVTVTACGDEPEEPFGAPPVDHLEDDISPDPPLVGLEVTASGEVTEVVAPIAFRIDKDGTGEETDVAEFDDEDFDDLDVVDEGVLVIDVRETDVAEGTVVEVAGTVRRFDLAEAERLFDIDLDNEIYGAFSEELVIVADEVIPDPPRSTTSTKAAG